MDLALKIQSYDVIGHMHHLTSLKIVAELVVMPFRHLNCNLRLLTFFE